MMSETLNIENETIPRHVGLILDGNRRWAREHGLPTLEGHRLGYDNLKTITKSAINQGVSYVSAYIFSTENWQRSAREVKYLMNLALRMITKDLAELNEENIRVVWLGREEKLSPKLLKALKFAEDSTKGNTRGTLALCFNYGGQDEIVDAVRALVKKGLSPNEIAKGAFEKALYAPKIPPLDLLIRTSGELRLSGFMLYRAAYAELLFTDKYWPDFSEQDMREALVEYSRRDRRKGK